MFELPEYKTIAKQMNSVLIGKTISHGQLGNSPHKFVWYNRTPEEFSALAHGKIVGPAWSEGRWLFLSLEPGYLLTLGECGGKLLYHAPGEKRPLKYHLMVQFDDGSALSAFTQMWGAMELWERGRERERLYIKDMCVTPDSPDFTFEYFDAMIDALLVGPKRSVKSLLTQEQIIPGLGNAIAQDILFNARLLPRRALSELSTGQRRDLFTAIVDTVAEVIALGGRDDETDLFGCSGGYLRRMDARSLSHPCPRCGGMVQKIQYLGGACYFCAGCQV